MTVDSCTHFPSVLKAAVPSCGHPVKVERPLPRQWFGCFPLSKHFFSEEALLSKRLPPRWAASILCKQQQALGNTHGHEEWRSAGGVGPYDGITFNDGRCNSVIWESQAYFSSCISFARTHVVRVPATCSGRRAFDLLVHSSDVPGIKMHSLPLFPLERHQGLEPGWEWDAHTFSPSQL